MTIEEVAQALTDLVDRHGENEGIEVDQDEHGPREAGPVSEDALDFVIEVHSTGRTYRIIVEAM